MNYKTNSQAGLPRWKTRITILSSILASAYILAAYSSFTRPIWIDEFLHYTLGSHRTMSEAWLSISETLPTFNFAKTTWFPAPFGVSLLLVAKKR